MGSAASLHRAPLALGAAGAAAALGYLEGVQSAFAAALSVFGAGSLWGYLLWRFHRAAPAVASRAPCDELTTPIGEMIPVWSRQVRTARQSADDAVRQLASAFSSIARDLESSVQRSRSVQEALASDRGRLTATRCAREDLARIVETLRGAQSGKSIALEEIGRYAVELRETTREMQEQALQTRLIALNAGIEASRAGDSGRSFGAIAKELEALTRTSEQTSMRMQRQVRVLAATLEKLDDGAGGMASGMQSIQDAQRTTTRVIERFEEVTALLAESVESMKGDTRRVYDGLADALVGLQFQDRVSQILDHTAAELEALGALLREGSVTGDALCRLRESMGADYSTPEEFRNLQLAKAAAPKAALATEVTFF